MSDLRDGNLVEKSKRLVWARFNQYTAGEILRAMEGNLSPKGVSEGNTVSSVGNDAFWQGFDEAVNHYVDSITLEQIAEKNREFNGFDYVI